jgi:hypothetical protein
MNADAPKPENNEQKEEIDSAARMKSRASSGSECEESEHAKRVDDTFKEVSSAMFEC